MTANFYIKLYRLTSADGLNILELIGYSETLSETELVSTYAEHWIREIRPQCQDEVQCRAVMYRSILETSLEAPPPPSCSPLLPYAWAHLMTDATQQGVCIRDLMAKN